MSEVAKTVEPDAIASRLIEAAKNESRVRVRTMNHPELVVTAEPARAGNYLVGLNPDTDAPIDGELFVMSRNGYLLVAHSPEEEGGWMTYHPFEYVKEVNEK